MKERLHKEELYIGVMSGTSMDAVDAVLISITHNKFQTLACQSSTISPELKQQLSALCFPGNNEIERSAHLDILFAELIADTVNTLLIKQNLKAQDICAIGSHGQTIRHCPEAKKPFSLQIGNPSIIAHKTGITTIADFRMADIAAEGQGAPLVPAFHQAVFNPETGCRAIINIGGIANITLLHTKSNDAKNNIVKGYDIGPGNTLMDQWILKHKHTPIDLDGEWARSGNILPELLEKFLADAFIQKKPPKSSGREYFNLAWLDTFSPYQANNEDIQRTLLEFTAQVLADTVNHETNGTPCEIYLCGGGVKNRFLYERINALLPDYRIASTGNLGIDAQLVEGAAFAWLASQTMQNLPGNIESVTGASCAKILGGIYLA